MIYIYQDKGVSKVSCFLLEQDLKKIFPKKEIKRINALDVIENAWEKDAQAFLMPGGADVYYKKHLTRTGIYNIQRYVKDGGCYLGICAGAYFAADSIEFSKNTPLEIVEERDLGFFPGIARGPLFSPYFYDSHQGAVLAFLESVSPAKKSFPVYYNGGCYFVEAGKKKNIHVLYHYQDFRRSSLKAAIILCHVQKGKAILSGVHPEYTWEAVKCAFEKKEPGYQTLQGMHSALKESDTNSLLKELFQHLEIF